MDKTHHSYKSIREIVETQEIDIPESYLQRSLEAYGYSEFPESGLTDRGAAKLLKSATEMYHAESDLNKIQYKKSKKDSLEVIKVKNQDKPLKEKSLEKSILMNDLKKIGKDTLYFCEAIGKLCLGGFFIAPTSAQGLKRETENSPIYQAVYLIGGIETLLSQLYLWGTESKWALPVTLFQIGTNTASGLYEWYRSIKERTKKTEEEPEGSRRQRFDQNPSLEIEFQESNHERFNNTKAKEKYKLDQKRISSFLENVTIDKYNNILEKDPSNH
jgi:hypothetical protein